MIRCMRLKCKAPAVGYLVMCFRPATAGSLFRFTDRPLEVDFPEIIVCQRLGRMLCQEGKKQSDLISSLLSNNDFCHMLVHYCIESTGCPPDLGSMKTGLRYFH